MGIRISWQEAIAKGYVSPGEMPTATPGLAPASPQPIKASRGPRKRDFESEEQALLVKTFRFEFPDIGPLLIHKRNG